MRVLHIDYQQIRRYGHTHGNWVEKLAFGMIRNEHYLQSFSDRDVAAFEAPFGIRDLGWKKANQRAIEMVEATQPDLIVLGHCDKITNKTVTEFRRLVPSTLIAHCNCDPLFVPYNVENIKMRAEVADAIFVTTGKRELAQFEGRKARAFHIPNPVDPAIETIDNSTRTDLGIDLLFCSNATKYSDRGILVDHIRTGLGNRLNFKIYGSFGAPPVWGRDYDKVLADTKMSLNLNRQEGNYWYTSDRMAQLGGNGILQFTSDRQNFDTLFPSETLVYFKDKDDLLKKINMFHNEDELRRLWAENTRKFFHQEMNSTLYAQFIVEATLGESFSHDYVWALDTLPNGTLK